MPATPPSATRPVPPLRPFGTAELLDGAVRLVRRNLRTVLPVSLPVAVLSALLTALLQYAVVSSSDVASFAFLGGLLLAAGVGALLTGVLAPMFGADLLGERVTGRESLRRLGRSVWGLPLLGLVVVVCEGAGVVTFGALSVWLWGVWAVAAPALALERLGPWRALGRSYQLVRGRFWRTWGIRALGWVLTSVLGFFLTLPFQLLALLLAGSDALGAPGGVDRPGLYVLLISLGSLVDAAILAPVSAAIDVMLYTDLRMRAEGMDILLALPPEPVAAPVTAW